jgi:hypothetical protein
MKRKTSPTPKETTKLVKSLYASGNAKSTIMYSIENYVDVSNNTFSIPHELWRSWRDGNVELFLDCLNEFIDDNELPLPYPYSESECINDFCKLVRLEADSLMTVTVFLENTITF